MKSKVPIEEATPVAEALRSAFLSWNYLKAEVVGSVRRRKLEVGDIEVLVDGRRKGTGPGTLGTDPYAPQPEEFRRHLEAMGLHEAGPDSKGRKAPNGPRYYKREFTLPGDRQVQVDVCVCLPPAQWGVLELIRTGDKDFSQAMVTRLHRVGLESDEGRIHITDRSEYHWPTESDYMNCGDEAQFFAYCQLPFIAPENRNWDDPKTQQLVLGP